VPALGNDDGAREGTLTVDFVLNGAEAMARAAELANVKVAPIFPITPQTKVIETFAENGRVATVRGNSEYNVMALASGAAWAGMRVFSASSSQGLVMMSEMMWEVAGNRLPIVLGVFGRALKGPGWNLGAQQNDSLMMRDTGWLIFYCETAQELFDFILVAYRVGEEHHFPAMVVGDGFYLSHTSEVVSVPEEHLVRQFLPESPPTRGLPLPAEPMAYGTLTTGFQHQEFYRKYHEEMEALADGAMDGVFAEFGALFGRQYDLVEGFNLEQAEIVVVSTATIAGTVRALIRDDPDRWRKVGFVKLRSVRPLPGRKLAACLGGARKVVVIDRNLSPCIGGIVASEVSVELQRYAEPPVPWIYSVVCGLGGANVDRAMLAALFEEVQLSSRPERVYFLDEDIHVQAR
jgi:pyruvate/2-oxoacid:ferredoxin oxidoreductase alpha subunit